MASTPQAAQQRGINLANHNHNHNPNVRSEAESGVAHVLLQRRQQRLQLFMRVQARDLARCK